LSTVQRTVKVDSTLVKAAKQEGTLLNRSTSAQIEHWIRLGRAFENALGVSQAKVQRALVGEITIDGLTDREAEAYLANLASSMQTPSQAERDFYASLGEPSEAAGMDEAELYGDTLSHPDQTCANTAE